MLETLRLLSPYQLAEFLFNLIPFNEDYDTVIDLSPNEQWSLHLHTDYDMYEFVNKTSGLRIRVTPYDKNYKHMYVLKKFIPWIVEKFYEEEIICNLNFVARAIMGGYTENNELKVIPVGKISKFDITTDSKGCHDFFKLHHQIRNNGIRFKTFNELEKWIKDNGLSIKRIDDKTVYLSNPWNEKLLCIFDIATEEGVEFYEMHIEDTANNKFYYYGSFLADKFLRWITTELACRGPHFLG